MLERGQVVFPFRLATLEVYRPTPAVGEELACMAAISLQGEHLLSADIDVLDANGHCWMRMTGWEDKRFAVPARFAPLARPAKLAPLSSQWEAPQAPYPQQTVVCRRMDSRLPVDRALWKPVWAGRVLGPHEREIFAALELPETRELEWLAARTAGKECVAELLRATHGLELLHAEIEILPDEQGTPIVFCPALDGLGEAPAISLTHTSGQAAALAAFAPPNGGVGIDIEQLQPRAHGFAQAAFTAAEQELLEQLSPNATDEWLLRIWCAREAAGKALGTGLTGGATAPRVSAIDVERGTLLVDVAHRQLIVWTHCDGELVVATAVDAGLVTAQATR
jgi:phosphopantetheinyl transferase